MLVDTSKMVSAGDVLPDGKLYVVVFTRDHPTLAVGDVVKMVDCNNVNLFVRVDDLTVHRIIHEGEYVVVIPKE